MIDAEKSDLYDVLAYIAFALAPITREERADGSRPFIASHYDPKLQAFLGFVLSQYVKEGVGETLLQAARLRDPRGPRSSSVRNNQPNQPHGPTGHAHQPSRGPRRQYAARA